MNSKVLTIIGNVGSGKSSAMPVIVETLEAHPIYADDLFQTTDPFAKRYLKDIKRWSFTNELWLTLERSEMLTKELSTNTKDWVVVDSGLLMSWVYTFSHLLVGEMDQDEWRLYERLYDRLLEGIRIDVVVSLRYSMDTLMKRIEKRGRDYELEYYTRDYLGQLEEGMDALEKKLKQSGVSILRIDEDRIEDFVKNVNDTNRLRESIFQLNS